MSMSKRHKIRFGLALYDLEKESMIDAKSAWSRRKIVEKSVEFFCRWIDVRVMDVSE